MYAENLASINDQAREWFTLMQSGSATTLEQEQLNSWLEKDPRHLEAYAQYETLWADLGQLQHTAEYSALKHSVTPSVLERTAEFIRQLMPQPNFAQWAMVTASILAIGIFVFLKQPQITTEIYATNTSEIKEIILKDGSKVTLGAKSQIKTWNTDSERHVDLVSGQAFFVVTKNPKQPFIVKAGSTKVRVVGTQFDVRRGLDRTRVAVIEGIVAVSSLQENSGEPPVTLTAGQQTSHLTNNHFEKISGISVSELESWRKGKLIYLRASLADVVADANRYYNGNIRLDSAALADLKVTAAVSTNQIDSLTEMLEKTLPVKLQKDAQNNIVIQEIHSK